MSDKRKALQAQKEKILAEIKYYEKRIEEARANTKKSTFYEDDDSSDDEYLKKSYSSPSILELKQKQAMLKTCLQATQELTSLEVLQSEVNVLVDDPPLDGASPVAGEGIWREVMAECCLDLVPFAITFYAFKANGNFAPVQYKNVKVTIIKKAHDVELAKSVLPGLRRPSDVVEVIRSYAHAHRSRRTTLARLADKFSSSLVLEPIPDGGYLMKCANLLEVSWTLQNKWSPVAPFHHRMKFDLEYMDEAYIKTITQAHRQLSEPDLETDERTLLLAKIISTCLEAQGPTQELHESMSSDPETAHAWHKRRTTLDREPDAPGAKRTKNSEVMAPPKGIPKKVKKGKENVDSNKKTTKRPVEHNENNDNPKKAKTVENAEDKEANNEEKTMNDDHSVATSKNNEANKKIGAISRSGGIKKKSAKNTVNEEGNAKDVNGPQVHDIEKPSLAKNTKIPVQNSAKTDTKVSKTNDKTEKPKEKTEKFNENIVKDTKKSSDKVLKPDRRVESTKGSETNLIKAKTSEKIAKKPPNDEKVLKDKDNAKVVKKVVSSVKQNKITNDVNFKNAAGDSNTKNNIESNIIKSNGDKTTASEGNTNLATDVNKTSKTDVAGNTVGKITKKIVSNVKVVKKPAPAKISSKETENNEQKVKKIASAPNINAKISEKGNKVTKTIPGKTGITSNNKNADVASGEKNLKTNPTQTKVPKAINAEKPKNAVPKIGIIPNKPKATVPSKKIITSNTKPLSAGITGKENGQNNMKVSKPLKKFFSENTSKLPLRVSPRQPLKSKVLSKFGTQTQLKPK